MSTVIIGNSAAGLNAAEEMRSRGYEGEVIMISSEEGPAYSRVLLPYVLRGVYPSLDKITIRDDEYYRRQGIRYIEDTVLKVDPESRELELKDHGSLSCENLLVASGSSPFKPPIPGLEGDRVLHMWTMEDARRLESLFEGGGRVLVLGSGFVSLQAAWAAVVRGLQVDVYELMPRIMPLVLDEKSAGLLVDKMESFGVRLKRGISTTGVEHLEDGRLKVSAKDEEDIIVDFIIVGTGVRPNVAFLEGTGVAVDRGILVNEYMETSVPGIYAAGDVAQGPTTFGDAHVIHALWPTAVEEGKIAGANMAGFREAYEGSLNMNVTGMFDLTVASMGVFNEAENTVAWEYDLGPKGIMKVVLADGVPLGGALIGSSELVQFLGMLRPFIRKHSRLDCRREDFFTYLRTESVAGKPVQSRRQP